MIAESTEALLAYLADLIETAERYGATILPPDDGEEASWERDRADLVMELEMGLPATRRSRPAEIALAERWGPGGRDQWVLVEYAYELRHHELDYRRALHRHDVDHFVRAFGVATHEHCEVPMGHAVCGHYAGEPPRGAIDGFLRLLDLWLSGERPRCSNLRCFG